METKLTKRVQKITAHTAVTESAMEMKPTRLAQTMVASRQANVKKDTFLTVLTMTAAMQTGLETESVTA